MSKVKGSSAKKLNITSCIVMLVALIGLLPTSAALATKPQPITGQFELIDVDNAGARATDAGTSGGMSKDGWFVLFYSDSSNLGANGWQFFLRDRTTQTTELVSIRPDGSQDPRTNDEAFVSSDGNFVSWFSESDGLYLRDRSLQATTLLIPRSTTFEIGVFPPKAGQLRYMSPDARFFVYFARSPYSFGYFSDWLYDRQTDTYAQLTGDSPNGNGPGVLSDDGRYYVHATNPSSGQRDVMLVDRTLGGAQPIYPNGITPNGSSTNPYMSADARYIVFESAATNLLPQDPGPGIFLLDRQTSTLERINVTNTGEQAQSVYETLPEVTDDGNYVLFISTAPNLNPYYDPRHPDASPYGAFYIRNRITGITELISQDPVCEGVLPVIPNNPLGRPNISTDGRYVEFSSRRPEDSSIQDTFVRDRNIPFDRLAHHCR